MKKKLNIFRYIGVDEDLVQRLLVSEDFANLSVLRKEGSEILVRQNVLEHQYNHAYGPELLPNDLNKNSFNYMKEILVDLNEYDFYWEKLNLELEGLDYQIYQSLKIDILNGSFFYSKSKLSVVKPLLNLYYKNFDLECQKCFQINGNGCRDIIDNISCHYLNVINSPDLKPLLIKTNFSWVPSILGLTVFNYMSGCMVYNINIYDFCSMQEMHTALFNSLELITTFTTHVGNSIDLININNLPSYNSDLYPNLNISDIFSSNRLILKKIPVIGDLIFKIADYFCRQEQFLNLGYFTESTINTSIKYSVNLGNYFHITNINDFVDGYSYSISNNSPVGLPNIILATKILMGGVVFLAILKYFIK